MVAQLITTQRKLRQPDILAYPSTPDVLEARINVAFDALLASCHDTLTDAEWADVFALYDCRRLLASPDPADWRLVAQVVDAVSRRVSLENL